MNHLCCSVFITHSQTRHCTPDECSIWLIVVNVVEHIIWTRIQKVCHWDQNDWLNFTLHDLLNTVWLDSDKQLNPLLKNCYQLSFLMWIYLSAPLRLQARFTIWTSPWAKAWDWNQWKRELNIELYKGRNNRRSTVANYMSMTTPTRHQMPTSLQPIQKGLEKKPCSVNHLVEPWTPDPRAIWISVYTFFKE